MFLSGLDHSLDDHSCTRTTLNLSESSNLGQPYLVRLTSSDISRNIKLTITVSTEVTHGLRPLKSIIWGLNIYLVPAYTTFYLLLVGNTKMVISRDTELRIG